MPSRRWSTSSAGSARLPRLPGRWQGDTAGQPCQASAAPRAHHRGILYLADAGYASHHLLCVTVVLHSSLAEEEVDLVIVSREAPHALRDVGRADKMRFYGKRNGISIGGEGGLGALTVSLTHIALSPLTSNSGLTIEPEGQVLCLHGVVRPHVT